MRHLAYLMAATAALSACENGPNPFAGKGNSIDAPTTAEAATSVRMVDRDVEAPEVFKTTDTALWDGRPSLGGVWVASPDAVNPERVILRNEANGKFVIGALFRRERDNPGPKLQISSDAADALGMLAGQPGSLNVTALRREGSETAVTAAPPATATLAANEGDVESAPIDPIAAAGAAIDRADGTADGTNAGGDAEGAAIAAAPLNDLDPTPREGETKRDARKRVRAAKKAASIAETVEPAVDAAANSDGEAALAAPVPALEVATLPDATQAVADPAPSSGSARVQIGIFSIEANAQRAADTLKSGGISADVRKEESNGKVFWSVVASGSGGSKALLAKVKDLGFGDAYAVSG